MKKIGKEILRHGSWILVIILLFKQCGMNKEVAKVQQLLAGKDQIIAEKQKEIGTIQSTVKSKEVDFKRALGEKDSHAQELKEQVKDMDVKVRNLRTIITNTIEIRDTVYMQVVPFLPLEPIEHDVMAFADMMIEAPIDSSLQPNIKYFGYRDKWIDIHGKMVKDSVKMYYTLWEEHTMITHYSKPRLFKPREMTIEFESTNPNARLIGSEAYYKKLPKPVLSFGVDIGMGAMVNKTGIHVGPYIGVSAHYPIYTIYKK